MKTLKRIREEYGITQQELAAAFGVSPKTIQNVERNSSNIKDSLLRKYTQAFSIKYDDIFLGNEYEIFEFHEKEKARILVKFKHKQLVQEV